MIVSIEPKKINNISRNFQEKAFYWYQYSPRCACIVSLDFNTVYYFAFTDYQTALAFTKAIHQKYCQKAEIRKVRRFNQQGFTHEVKVWGMSESTFSYFVKRDLNDNN